MERTGTIARARTAVVESAYGSARTSLEASLGGRTRSLPARLAWMVLALLLTCLALGGLISAIKMSDLVSAIVDLAISALLGWGAVGCWRRTAATSRNGSATS